MAYEEIQGETMPILLNSDLGFSGNSTEWDGADQSYIKVYWTSTGGITNSGNWFEFNLEGEITSIINSTDDTETKKEKINAILYPRITMMLDSTDQTEWGYFRNQYRPCVTVG